MNFSNIEYFIATMEELNITRAANRLHITQQTLSAQIAALEKELGCTLFYRKSPLVLTYAGTVFAKYAVNFMKNYESMKNEFSDICNEQSGKINVGVGYTRGRVLLPRIIKTFHEIYPLVDVNIIEGTNKDIQRMLVSDEIDVGFAYISEFLSNVEVEKYYEEEMCLLVSRELMHNSFGRAETGKILAGIHTGRDLSAVKNLPFIISDSNDIAGKLGQNLLGQAGFTPNVKMESRNMELLLELCLMGEGVCFCPEILFRNVLSSREQDMLYQIHFTEDARFDISIACPNKKYRPRFLEEFIALAKQQIASV